jgi:hypothetical protein
MSLSILRLVSTLYKYIYRRIEQYFDISTLGTCIYRAIFLPFLAKNPLLINNWSIKDEAVFDKCL